MYDELAIVVGRTLPQVASLSLMWILSMSQIMVTVLNLSQTMWKKVWSKKGRTQLSHLPLGREFPSPAKDDVHLLILMIVC